MTQLPCPLRRRTVTGVILAIGAMLSVQSGLAMSLDLARQLGPEVVAWLRLSMAGAAFLLVTRPWTLR